MEYFEGVVPEGVPFARIGVFLNASGEEETKVFTPTGVPVSEFETFVRWDGRPFKTNEVEVRLSTVEFKTEAAFTKKALKKRPADRPDYEEVRAPKGSRVRIPTDEESATFCRNVLTQLRKERDERA